jgi:uncharacterized membrane protein
MIVEHTTLIEAPSEQIWAVTIDVERWHEWTPTVTSVLRVDQGEFKVDSVARIKQPGLPECCWRVTEFSEGFGFTWETRLYGMVMAASHEIMPHKLGTKNTLKLTMHGKLARLLWPVIRGKLHKTLERENTALKAKVEG